MKLGHRPVIITTKQKKTKKTHNAKATLNQFYVVCQVKKGRLGDDILPYEVQIMAAFQH